MSKSGSEAHRLIAKFGIEQIAAWYQEPSKLQRATVDGEGWLQLKLSCTPGVARRLAQAATEHLKTTGAK